MAPVRLTMPGLLVERRLTAVLSLPKVNGAMGIVLRGFISVITGPAQIHGLRQEVAVLSLDSKEMRKDLNKVVADMRGVSGFIKGYVEGHGQQDQPR